MIHITSWLEIKLTMLHKDSQVSQPIIIDSIAFHQYCILY